jgi:hypothetical protein
MEAKFFLLSERQNKKTTLDKAYQKHISYILQTLDEEKENRWETYSLVISEINKMSVKGYVNELKYRLTDGEDPNKVILDIIEREIETMDSLVWFLKRRIEEYLEDDFYNRFLV